MMMARGLGLALGVAGLVAVSSLPARAQMVDDFLCSTFNMHCREQPPLPPPSLAPEAAPAEAKPVKHVHHAKKKKTAKPKAAGAADTAAPATPEPAAK